MEHISQYKKLSSKIDKIEAKIQKQHELKDLDLLVYKDRKENKISAFKYKQSRLLIVKKFALSNIEDEVNKRLAHRLIAVNKKDYWKRRALINAWRVAGRQNIEELDANLQALEKERATKEAQIKEKLTLELQKYIIADEEKRKIAQVELDEFIHICNEKEKTFNEDLVSKYKLKEEKRIKKHDDKVAKLLQKEEECRKLRENEENTSYSLSDDLVLKVENLTMQFGGLRAVDNLSFEVKQGEIFGLIGPNGAGKTTVFNCITQFYKPTAGKLYFKEKSGNTIELTDLKVHNVIKKGVVRTFQNVELVKETTVIDNLLIAAHTKYHSSLISQLLHLPILHKEEVAMRRKALEVLDFLGLSNYANFLCWGLPYGILKKIEIARTLMHNPQLIILDEPAAGLNESETQELKKIIRMIQEKYKCTILLVEHDMGLVMDICDTVLAISFGKLLKMGTTLEIQQSKEVQEAYLGTSGDE